ncbi:MAG: hypothetical protein ABEI96_03915 [Haloarculaceae archaeon]
MNSRNEPTQSDPAPNPARVHRGRSDRIEQCSIRVLVDSNTSHTCEHCDQEIEERTQYRVVTVREPAGTTTEYAFCDEQCRGSHFPTLD